jgi:pimeloyl-ACP methyl ester carboxylesterase
MIRKTSVNDIDVYIEGDGSETIVMIHGWPDTFRLWDDLSNRLAGKKYTCVRFTLPGFDIRKPRRSYTPQELSDIFAGIVDAVSPEKKVTLVLHDWGCVFGYQYYMRNKDRVSRIVGLDVGDYDSKNMKLPAGMILFAAAYQLFLASAWLIGGKTGDAATRWLAKKFHVRGDSRQIWSGMNYPYFHFWRNTILRRPQGTIPFTPDCPMLFLFGKNKPTMFHSDVFSGKLNATKGSRSLGFDAGHWLMSDRPEETAEEIKAWFSGRKSPHPLSHAEKEKSAEPAPMKKEQIRTPVKKKSTGVFSKKAAPRTSSAKKRRKPSVRKSASKPSKKTAVRKSGLTSAKKILKKKR